LATPLEVYQGLAADGYQVSYRRVPLSRERTPEAADLDVLHQQLMTQPVGQFPCASHVLALPVRLVLLASGFALQQLIPHLGKTPVPTSFPALSHAVILSLSMPIGAQQPDRLLLRLPCACISLLHCCLAH